MLSHSSTALTFARKCVSSVLLSELSDCSPWLSWRSRVATCLFVVFSDLSAVARLAEPSRDRCGSGSAFPDLSKTGALLVSTSLIVVRSKVIGSSVFVRAILAIKPRMQMATLKVIRFRKTTLKCLTFAFLNEHPPQIRVIRFAIVQFNLSTSMKPPVSELLVVLYPKGCHNSIQIGAKRPLLSQLPAFGRERRLL